MMQIKMLSPLHGLKQLIWSVWLEGLRRKEFYAFFIVAFLFILTAFAIRMVGVENPATGTFVLNLGMTYCSFAAHLMVIILGARMIPVEIENRTIYPILAKPVNRFTYLLGKWLATGLFGSAAFLVLLLFVWGASPKLEEYDTLLFLQMIFLQGISLFALSAMAILFSLIFPPAVSLILSLMVFFFGGKISGFLVLHFQAELLRWLIQLIPDYTRMNLITRYTDGIEPVSFGLLFWLVFYGVILTVSAVLFSNGIFQKRPL